MPTTLTSGVSLTQVGLRDVSLVVALELLLARDASTRLLQHVAMTQNPKAWQNPNASTCCWQAAGGNTALALGLTVGTNMLGIFTMPFVIAAVLGSGAGVNIDPAPFMANLAKTILAPVLIGALVRRQLPALREWVDGHKKAVSMATSTLLITVPWAQSSCEAHGRLQLTDTSPPHPLHTP
eukprot:1183539-Prorocentrum_minimum.AAC.7